MATDGNFIEFEGKFYAIDVDKLISWVTKKPEPSKDRTKVETWGLVPDDTGDNEFRVLQKEVSENITENTDTVGGLRYDLIKNLLNLVLSPIADENGGIHRINTFSDMFLGQAISFNTLLNEGIIIEIGEE